MTTASGMSATVLCASSAPKFRALVRRVAISLGLEVEWASLTRVSALSDFERGCRDCCLIVDVPKAVARAASRRSSYTAISLPVPILFAVHRGDVQSAVAAARAGAAGILEKPLTQVTLADHLRTAQLFRDRYMNHRQACFPFAYALSPLTERESQILTLLLQGWSNQQIAKSLRLGLRTIEADRAQIMRKYGVASLAELLCLVTEAGGQIRRQQVDAFAALLRNRQRQISASARRTVVD